MANVIAFENKKDKQGTEKIRKDFDYHMDTRHKLIEEFDAEQNRLKIKNENGKLRPEDIDHMIRLMSEISKESSIISELLRDMGVTPPEDEVDFNEIAKQVRQDVYGLHIAE